MEHLPAYDTRTFGCMTSRELRRSYVAGRLFTPGRVVLRHWETDRTVVGGAVPLGRPLPLSAPPELKAEHFNDRRELGIINLGGPGTVRVDGRRFALGKFDSLYVGRGVRRVVFASRRSRTPAQFYLLSYPAHARYPTRLARRAATPGINLGTPEEYNRRTLYRVIHPGGVKSCQLVMGFTILAPGSKWNTMPPHTHLRRSEVYLYCDLPPRARLTHYMGPPARIRKLPLRDRQAVLSPPWSIHCGVGSTHYAFVWGMGGENQDFSDMDPVDPRKIR
ncbi:MAG: 5-dehydro-4-deoxy-D-glucuronate isomerase [Opitutales bacterium]